MKYSLFVLISLLENGDKTITAVSVILPLNNPKY